MYQWSEHIFKTATEAIHTKQLTYYAPFNLTIQMYHLFTIYYCLLVFLFYLVSYLEHKDMSTFLKLSNFEHDVGLELDGHFQLLPTA